MSSKLKAIKSVVDLFNSDRIRLLTNTELQLMGFIEALGEDATTTNLNHAMTISAGKPVTFGQITTPLKQLGTQNLIFVGRVRSPSSGRMQDLYALTDEGKEAYEAAVDMANALQDAIKTKGKPPEEQQEVTAFMSELARAAEAVREGKPLPIFTKEEPTEEQQVVADTLNGGEEEAPFPYTGQPTWDEPSEQEEEATGDESSHPEYEGTREPAKRRRRAREEA
jgi:DNA-binding PadR family transcriptional regulator